MAWMACIDDPYWNLRIEHKPLFLKKELHKSQGKHEFMLNDVFRRSCEAGTESGAAGSIAAVGRRELAITFQRRHDESELKTCPDGTSGPPIEPINSRSGHVVLIIR
jgi:hypothetical protein